MANFTDTKGNGTFRDEYIKMIVDCMNKGNDPIKWEMVLNDEYAIRLRGGYFQNREGEKVAKLVTKYSTKKVNLCYKVVGYEVRFAEY